MNDQEVSPYAGAIFLLASLNGNSRKYITPYLLYSGCSSFIVVSFFLPFFVYLPGVCCGVFLFGCLFLDLGEFF